MSDIQRDREERQHVIEVLEHMLEWMKAANTVLSKPERIKALDYAINSLKTDLKYDLLYEETSGQADKPTTKNNLGVDKEQLKTMIRGLTKWYVKRDNTEVGEPNTAVGLLYDDVMFGIDRLPSVTPQEPKTGHWIPIYQGDEIIDYRCSECEFGNTFGKGTIGMNFCPRCGSDNREVVEK